MSFCSNAGRDLQSCRKYKNRPAFCSSAGRRLNSCRGGQASSSSGSSSRRPVSSYSSGRPSSLSSFSSGAFSYNPNNYVLPESWDRSTVQDWMDTYATPSPYQPPNFGMPTRSQNPILYGGGGNPILYDGGGTIGGPGTAFATYGSSSSGYTNGSVNTQDMASSDSSGPLNTNQLNAVDLLNRVTAAQTETARLKALVEQSLHQTPYIPPIIFGPGPYGPPPLRPTPRRY